jgi:probable HAF family extracellular repeat protein
LFKGLSAAPGHERGAGAVWVYRLACVSVAALVLGGIGQPAAAYATDYRVTRLPAQIYPVAINDWGTVVARGEFTGTYVWKRGSLTPIPGLLGYPDDQAVDINDRGTVVGTAYTADSNTRPFIWNRATGTRDLGGPVASTCHPGYQKDFHVAALNNFDHAVGAIGDTDCSLDAVRWVNQRMLYLTQRLATSSANDVNDHGQIVGFDTQTVPGGPLEPYFAFIWQAGQPVHRLRFHTSDTFATGINNDGAVVGTDDLGGWVWAAGRGMRSLGYVYDVQITNSMIAANTPDGVTLWTVGGRNRHQIADLPRGWQLDSLADINERGQILAVAHRPGVEPTGVVLTPVVL